MTDFLKWVILNLEWAPILKDSGTVSVFKFFDLTTFCEKPANFINETFI